MSADARHSPALALVVALIIAIVAACSGPEPADSGGGAPGRGVYVPIEWKTDRVVSGHREHVVKRHVACTACHELTSDSMGKVTPMRCAACHTKAATFEHAHRDAQAKFGAEATTDCTTCHAFTADGAGHPGADPLPSVAPPTACARCHVSKGNDAFQVETHGTSACVTCHLPHQNGKPHGGPCVDCHLRVKTGHATANKTPSEVCTTCHSHQHAPASEAVGTCQGCHASQKPLIPRTALFDGGHTKCVGCHKSHDFTKDSVARCQSCHEGIHVLGVPRVQQHARCENCHSPHDVRGVSDRVCATCHENVHPEHPKAAGSCIGCHTPHPSGASLGALSRPCSICHQLATSDHAFHGGVACPKCHTPHEFKVSLAGRSLCQGCHGKQVALVASNAGHQACRGCHAGLPHRPTQLLADCGTCHAAVVAVATKGHGECIRCHEPHSGAFATECKACHAAEARTAPTGHQACTNCHEQHGGQQKAPCAGCHHTEAASPHGKIPGGCASCHRPHGPSGIASPPACATCHDPAKLPGLHGVAKHQACKSCHTGHDDPSVPLRVPCLTCHVDRKDHFPAAPSCTSCHLFGPTR